MEKSVLQNVSKGKEIPVKIFRAAYKIAKDNQSFNTFEAEIDLQGLNGLVMGHILHSTNACITSLTILHMK